jgi:hypothetical protein
VVSFPSRDEGSLLGQTQETYCKSENEFAVSNPHGIVWTMLRLWRGAWHRIMDVATRRRLRVMTVLNFARPSQRRRF